VEELVMVTPEVVGHIDPVISMTVMLGMAGAQRFSKTARVGHPVWRTPEEEERT
jgi:hypothetical protein